MKINWNRYVGKVAPLEVKEIVSIDKENNEENNEEPENTRPDCYDHDDEDND